MRRVLIFLGVVRDRRAPRPTVLAALVGGAGGFLTLMGIAFMVGTASAERPAPLWICLTAIVVGVACSFSAGRLPPRRDGDDGSSR